MPQRNKPFLRKAPRNEILVVEANQISAVRQHPAVDPENPRTEKFESSVLSQILLPLTSHFYIRTQDGTFKSTKENSAIPTFVDMTDETRTRILQVVFQWGAAPSVMVGRLLGLTARQIGAIRRWHVPNWRELLNADINRANNYRRLIA